MNHNNSRFDNLLFDLDGTISNPKEGIVNCINYAVDRIEGKLLSPESLEQYIGPPLEEIFFSVLRVPDENNIKYAVQLYKEKYHDDGWKQNVLYNGIHDVLRRLNESGKECYICTTKSTKIAKLIIKHFKLGQYFKEVFGCDGGRKKSEIISSIIDNYSLDKRKTAMVGDRYIDMQAGVKNNIFTIGVSWGFGSENELINSGADIIIDQPAEIISFNNKDF
ncbi:MAG: HAD hydrolase-like protein [bacterium]